MFIKYSKLFAPVVDEASNVKLSPAQATSFETPETKLTTGSAVESTVIVTVFEAPEIIFEESGQLTEFKDVYTILLKAVVAESCGASYRTEVAPGISAKTPVFVLLCHW